MRLVRSESLHRIDRSGPTRRNESCHSGTNRQQQNCTKQSERIVASYPEKKLAHEMPREERGGNPERKADEHLPEHTSHHHRHHTGTRSSESHADANFIGASDHEVRHHSIEPDRGQDQGKDAEQTGEPRNEPVLIEISGNFRIVRAEVYDGEIGINGGKCLAGQSLWIRRCLGEVENDETDDMELFSAASASASLNPLNCWDSGRKKSGLTSLRKSVILKSEKTPTISNNPEYWGCRGQSASNRILIGEELPGECLVHNDYLPGSGRVLFREIPSTHNRDAD